MVAIKLAAIGLLMIGGTALSRTWQDKPGGATTQPEQQQPAQEQETAPADPPDADGDQATSGAEADSVDGDSAAGPEAPYWLLGRWCLRYQYYVMIRNRHSAAMMPDGTRHRYVLHPDGSFMNLQVVGIPPPAGDGRDEWLGRFDPAAGESSFRSFRDQPIVRCGFGRPAN